MRLLGLSVLGFLLVAASYSSADDNPIARSIPEDALMTVPELIEKNGYPVEVHHVDSADGYILEMHRIPYGRAEDAGPAPNKPVVFVQHGLLSSSADWIIAGPNKGLGYLLADLGYDVWMGNTRGNKYSRQHKSLSPTEAKFWNFSWHENGVYDLPAMIDYALLQTGQKQTFYIGHSQGTTAFFVMCSELPEYNNKIRAQFSFAPLAFMNHALSPLMKYIAWLNNAMPQMLLQVIGVKEFLLSPELLEKIAGAICSENSVTQFICTNTLFVLCGFNLEQLDMELLPIIMEHTPAGGSTKQILHYAQLSGLLTSKFRQYDYGALKNMVKYGQPTPSDYKLSEVTAPIALFYSHNDWLANKMDVDKLNSELPNAIGLFPVADKNFSHLDFLWGKNVDTLVYNKVFSLMSKY